MGVKVLVVADEECKSLWDYFSPDKLEGVDLIISCGDLNSNYLQFLVTFGNCPLLYIRGNHDVRYDETMNYGEDTKFVMNYLNAAEGKIKFILKPLYIYYAGTSTSTAKKSQGVWSNWQKCFDNLKHWVGKNPSWNQKRILALIYLKWRASWLRTKI